MITSTKTGRGFQLFEFEDRYGEPCSLQMSSLATESAIWFGTGGRMNQLASRVTEGGSGWVPFTPPEGVIVHSRMHLTQAQVRELLPLLQHFAETGELPEE